MKNIKKYLLIGFLLLITVNSCEMLDNYIADNATLYPVTNLYAVPGDEQVTLSWTSSASPDVSMVSISTTPSTGDPIIVNNGDTEVTITSLTNNIEYIFTVVAMSSDHNVSEGISIKATPVSDQTINTFEGTDDFESYSVGVQLDDANPTYILSNVEGTTNILEVSSDVANSGSNSIYLRDNSDENKPRFARELPVTNATSGSVGLSVYIPAGDHNGDTYLHLGGSSTASTSQRYTDIRFGSSTIKYRAPGGESYDITSFNHDEWIDLILSWSDDLITVVVNGVEYTTFTDDYGMEQPMIAENNEFPSYMVVYCGSSTEVGAHTYVDNLDLIEFDDTPVDNEGEETGEDLLPATVFYDHFDSYTVGYPLDVVSSSYLLSSVDGVSTFAEISSDQSNSGMQCLYLADNSYDTKPKVSRVFPNSYATSGTITLSVYVPHDGYVKPTYIYLGGSASASSSQRYTEFKCDTDSVQFRDLYGEWNYVAPNSADEWIDLEISWEGEVVSISVNGIEFLTYVDDFGVEQLMIAESIEYPSCVTLYCGDSTTIGTYSYIDDLQIVELNYNEEFVEGGGDVDDFESYSTGIPLDVVSNDYELYGVDGFTTIAEVSSDVANSGENSLYIEDSSTDNKPRVARVLPVSDADEGSVSISVYIPSDGYVKSTYVHLGGAINASSSSRFTEIIFGGSDIKFRNYDSVQMSVTSYEKDRWIDLTISWLGDVVSIIVDGIEYSTYQNHYDGLEYDMIAENDVLPSYLVVFCGDNSSTGTYAYIDDIDLSNF